MGRKYIHFGHKILMKQPHDCSYYLGANRREAKKWSLITESIREK